MLVNIAIILASYLIGAFPHLYFLCKIKRIDTTGDLHIHLWQGAGPFWGLSGVLVDVLKGAVPIWLGKALGLDLSVVVACGLAAVVGQMWPVFYKFDGEKGNTSGLGMALAIVWQPTIIAAIPAVCGLLSKLVRALSIKNQSMRNRFTSGAGQSDALPVGVFLSFLILPIASYWLGKPVEVTLGFIILYVVLMVRRLTQGLTEDINNRRSLIKALFYRLIYDRSRH
jgi:acyl phosphate:glycerol-3-phosphate acyltransferase